MTPKIRADLRLDKLDRLRGVAIIAVLLHHLAIFKPGPDIAGNLYTSLAEFSSHGVDLFFVLSGYLLVRSLPVVPKFGWMTGFWLRRAAKILPLYTLVLATVIGIVPTLLSLAGLPAKGSALLNTGGEWPWHVLFATNWLFFREGGFTNPLLNVAWSLGVEVQFYLILALAFLGGLARLPRFWLGLALVAVTGRCIGVALEWNWVCILNFSPGRLDAFAAGALVALRPSWFSRPVRLAGAAVLLAPLIVVWTRDSLWLQTVGYSWIALGAAAAVHIAAKPAATEGGNARGDPLAFFGRISYSIYLSHIVVRSVVRDLFLPPARTLIHAADWARLGGYVIGAGGLAIMLGWGLWRWIEAPAQNFLLTRLCPSEPRHKNPCL
jgi:peptidoglycan/LPS O-acetylase OafA/YrhL